MDRTSGRSFCRDALTSASAAGNGLRLDGQHDNVSAGDAFCYRGRGAHIVPACKPAALIFVGIHAGQGRCRMAVGDKSADEAGPHVSAAEKGNFLILDHG